MVKKTLLAILIVFVFCSVATAAIKDSPDGFRDMKWGDSAQKLGDSAMLYQEENILKTYIRKNDKLSIGDAALDMIVYYFSEDKLMSVGFTTKTKSNSLSLKEAMTERYGKSEQKNRYMEKYTWLEPAKVVIEYEYSPVKDMATVYIHSIPHIMEYDRIRMERAKGAADDF